MTFSSITPRGDLEAALEYESSWWEKEEEVSNSLFLECGCRVFQSDGEEGMMA
jgi:hypothetical protein